MKKLFFLFILSLILLWQSALADPSVKSPSIQTYSLKNGLHLYVKEDHRSPEVIVQVWYRVGGSYDPSGLTGISHMLEHMMFQGTKKYPAGEFAKIITEKGGSQNAYTSEDETVYFELLPVKYLSLALSLEADRMQNLQLDQQRFAKEHQVVMEEERMRIGNNPQAQVWQRLLAAAYVASPYQHMPIGWVDDIKQYNLAALQAWYKTWYAPNNAFIVVVGDVQAQQVYQQVQQYFNAIPARHDARIIPQANVAALGQRNVQVKLPAKVPVLLMGYNVPSIKTAEQDWQPYALLLLTSVLDEGDSSLLQQNLVRQQAVAAGLSVDYDPYARLDTLLQFSAVPTPGHTVDQVKQALLQQVSLLQSKGVTTQQLERAKTQLIADYIYSQDAISNQAQTIGQLALIGLPVDNQTYINHIRALTAEEVQQVAKQFLINDRLTVATLDPQPMTAIDAKKQLQAEQAANDKNLH